jgi:hypothetical protein
MEIITMEAAVSQTEIAKLFQADGPFASVYLATPGSVENAAQKVETRWRNVRREVAGAGVADEVLDEIEGLTMDAHTRGAALAVIAGPRGVLHSESLPTAPPGEDATVTVGPLPDVLPLLRQAQRSLPHLLVLTDRTGAEILVRLPGGRERTIEVEGGRGPELTRTAPGGWSQLRYQHRAENLWAANAGEVADRLTRLTDTLSPRLIAVAGDVRAVQLLTEALPERVTALIRDAGGDLASIDEVAELAAKLLDETIAAETAELLDRFAQERGQDDQAVEGVSATVEALAKAQVQTLLLREAAVAGRTAWIGPEPLHIALEPGALGAAGVGDPVEVSLAGAVVRAVLGGGGEVRLLDEDGDENGDAGPAAGVGGLLRWSD